MKQTMTILTIIQKPLISPLKGALRLCGANTAEPSDLRIIFKRSKTFIFVFHGKIINISSIYLCKGLVSSYGAGKINRGKLPSA